jgi:cell division protein FtsI (penicillin-binding protein 3)
VRRVAEPDRRAHVRSRDEDSSGELTPPPQRRRQHRESRRTAPARRREATIHRVLRTPRGRLLAILVVIGCIYGLLGMRLVELQAGEQQRYEQLGLDQRVQLVALPAERGGIFDRNGNDLAVSVSRSSVWADPRLIDDPDASAAALAPLVGGDPIALADELGQKDRSFVYVARQIERDVAAKVRRLDLAGIGFVGESKRYYPAGALAAPLLGFVGIDNNGLGGIEVGFDSTLAGKPGEMKVERDPQGRELPEGVQRVSAPERGSDLVLTIDQSLQYEVERVLADEVTKTRSRGGTAVLADVQTGDVLAMASVDGATAEVPAHPAPSSTPNRPLTDVFEPGSTNKVVTIAAALEAGLVNPSTMLQVPSRIVVDGQEFEDVHSHPTDLSVADIVRYSSNVGTIQIARMLGKARFDQALRSFGFGSPTGLDYPGEAPGILLPLEQYNDTSLASMPVGSGIAVTAMQMLDVYLTIANDGEARTPRLLKATIDADGNRREQPLGASRRVVSTETARTMQMLLESVVADGTGTNAQIAGYRVAGKTGTARKPPYEKPPYRYVISFAGFAPADSPRLAAIVVLDEPQVNATGGQAAAPTFARIMQYALAVDRVPATS